MVSVLAAVVACVRVCARCLARGAVSGVVCGVVSGMVDGVLGGALNAVCGVWWCPRCLCGAEVGVASRVPRGVLLGVASDASSRDKRGRSRAPARRGGRCGRPKPFTSPSLLSLTQNSAAGLAQVTKFQIYASADRPRSGAPRRRGRMPMVGVSLFLIKLYPASVLFLVSVNVVGGGGSAV